MSISLGRLVAINPSTPEFDSIPGDDLITFMPLEACWPDGRADTSRRALRSAVAAGYTRFRDGDILVPKITPTFEVGRVFRVASETTVGAGTTEIHVLRVVPGVDPRFIAYVCRSQPFLQEGSKSLQGVGNLRRIPVDFIRLFQVHVSSPREQTAIADYLDRETRRIDLLMAKQSILIRTLRERRDALVDLTFDAANGTTRTQVRHLLKSRPSYGVLVPQYVAFDETGAPFVRVGDLSGLDSKVPLPKITQSQSAEYSRTRLHGGEVLLGVVGNMGKSTIALQWLAGANVARAVAVLRCREGVDAEMLSRWLSSRHFLDQAMLATGGDSVQPTLGMRDFAGFTVYWPIEQTAKAFLTYRTAKIDTLVAKAERFISLAKERRSALITAAVTGQIDVRNQSRELTEAEPA